MAISIGSPGGPPPVPPSVDQSGLQSPEKKALEQAFAAVTATEKAIAGSSSGTQAPTPPSADHSTRGGENLPQPNAGKDLTKPANID